MPKPFAPEEVLRKTAVVVRHRRNHTAPSVDTSAAMGAASPLEESMIEKVKETGRIFWFKNRMVVNYDTVSLLVTNMPLDDPEFCRRIRDHAAMIAEAAPLALDNIVMRKAATDRTRELQEVAHMTVAAVDTLRQNCRALQMATRVDLEGMVAEVETMYHRLGLTPSQKDSISETARGATDHVADRLQNAAALPIEEENEDVSRIQLW